jgi:hypothetical protein
MGTAHRVVAGATAAALAALYPAAAQAVDDTDAGYTVTLTPDWHNPVPGTTHTITATVTPADGAVDPTGGTVLFTVTGANTGQGGPAILGEDDTAVLAYAGSWGDDTIDACFDLNGNDACDTDDPAALAYVSWRAEWPFVGAGGPYNGTAGEAVAISGISYQIDGEHDTTWTVSGPGTCTFGDPAASSTTVTCDTAGVYTLTFAASNSGYDPIPPDTAELTLTANEEPPANNAPTNDAGGPYSGVEDEPVALAGSASDVDEDDLSHTWIAKGPGSCTFSDAHSLTPTVTCDTHGYYKLILTTNDGQASTSDKAYLKIECEPKPEPTTPTPTPTEPSEEPTPPGEPTTPSLPVTGSSLSSVMASGVLLIALGVTALLFGRVRRARTES